MPRTVLPIQLGGIHSAGDLAKAPDGTSPDVENMMPRRGGGLAKRPAFTFRDARAGQIINFRDNNLSYLIVGDYAGGVGGKRKAGVWSALALQAPFDSAVLNGVTYGLTGVPGGVQGTMKYTDAAGATTKPFTWGGGGTSLEAAIQRIFVSGPTLYIDNLAVDQQCYAYDQVYWWQTIQVVTKTTDSRGYDNFSIAFTAANQTIQGQNIVLPDGMVTITQDFGPEEPSIEVPITIKLMNYTTGKEVLSRPVIISNKTENSDWERTALQANVAAGTYYVKYISGAPGVTWPGNCSVKLGCKALGQGSVGAGAVPKEANADAKGLNVTLGPIIYERIPMLSTVAGVGTSTMSEPHPDWIMGCDTDNISVWTFSISLADAPGGVNLVRSVAGKVIGFKKDAAFVYSVTDQPDSPLSLDGIIRGIGCTDYNSFDQHNGVAFFSNGRDVWSWDGQGAPVTVLSEGMRDAFLGTGGYAGSIIAYDWKDARLYVLGDDAKKIWVLDAQGGGWTHVFVPGADSLPQVVHDMKFMDLDDGTGPALFVTTTTGLKELERSASYDSDNAVTLSDGTASSYIFHALESPSPRHTITVQTITITHEATVASSGTLTLATSTDGGVTWGTHPFTITDLVAAGGDSKQATLPVYISGKKILMKLTHVGKLGDGAFNLLGAEATVIMRGPALPTNAVAS